MSEVMKKEDKIRLAIQNALLTARNVERVRGTPLSDTEINSLSIEITDLFFGRTVILEKPITKETSEITLEQAQEAYKKNYRQWRKIARERNIKEYSILPLKGNWGLRKTEDGYSLCSIVHSHPPSIFPPKNEFAITEDMEKPDKVPKDVWEQMWRVIEGLEEKEDE